MSKAELVEQKKRDGSPRFIFCHLTDQTRLSYAINCLPRPTHSETRQSESPDVVPIGLTSTAPLI